MAVLVIQWQSWVLETETLWPSKLKIFTIWPYTEKVCHPLDYRGGDRNPVEHCCSGQGLNLCLHVRWNESQNCNSPSSRKRKEKMDQRRIIEFGSWLDYQDSRERKVCFVFVLFVLFFFESVIEDDGFFVFSMFIYFWETERAWVGKGQRGRETQNSKQALGSELSAQSSTGAWTYEL